MARLPTVLVVVVVAVFVVLGVAPQADRFTWFLENAPVIIALPILIATRQRFPLTSLLYVLLSVHAVVLMVGGHWTYAKVPAGDWLREALGLARNPYDRLGHLMQGFVPVLLMRELLLRTGTLRDGALAVTVLLFMALGLSAAYELVEWLTAVATGDAAADFLGTQGDVWDSQWDMACALIGAGAALALLARWQDRQIAALTTHRALRPSPPGAILPP